MYQFPVAPVMLQNNQPQNLSDILRSIYLVHESVGFSGPQLDLLMHLWPAAGWLGTSGLAQMSWGCLAIG